MVHALPDDLAEHLHVIDDPAYGAHGIIALHSTALGPAVGGCRLWHYASSQNATLDAMRLARAMSYKNALAGLPFGGGKAVLRRPAGDFDRKALFKAFAKLLEDLKGQYVTAQDVGTNADDMDLVARHTRHVTGLTRRPGQAGGDPSPWTALGLFKAMQTAAQHTLGRDLDRVTVAVQGLGHVGAHLCTLLHQAGARLIVADADSARARMIAKAFGADVVSIDDILEVEADILAPCALGAVLNPKTIPHLKVALVCGGANNQLETEEDGHRLFRRGIVYAPDYVVNAGGIINNSAEYLGESVADVEARIAMIPERLARILRQSDLEHRAPHAVADALARAQILSMPRAPA
jgi:leucine dehydrogenase